MQKKSTDRQQPETAGRDEQNTPRSDVRYSRVDDENFHFANNPGETKDEKIFNPDEIIKANSDETKHEGERQNERLKAFQKNRRKGWQDIL